MSRFSIASLLERFYRSPFGRIMSCPAHWIARLQRPFMVYGFKDPGSKCFRKYVRMSSSVVLLGGENLRIGDHVWVGHYCVLDATGGLNIGEGCQLGSGVALYSHGSNNAIRLLGAHYVDIPYHERPGYVREPIEVGEYTFIGSGAVVLPGTKIGRACLIGANSVVRGTIPDYSKIVLPSARNVGSTLDLDAEAFRERDYSKTYFDPSLVRQLKESSNR